MLRALAVGALVISWVMQTGCVPTPPQPQTVPPPAQLIAIATAAVQVGAQMNRVWPGFWHDTTSFIIYQPARTTLLVSRNAPQGFTRVVLPKTHPLHGRAFVSKEPLPGLSGGVHPSYVLDGKRLTAVVPANDVAASIDLLFHEAFHGYQERAFKDAPALGGIATPVEPPVHDSLIASPQSIAFVEVERLILARAVDASSAELPALLRELDVVRSTRLRASTDVERAFLNIERKEGSAQWVGTQAAALLPGADTARILADLRAGLRQPAASDVAPYRRFRDFTYYSGSALAHVLHRMNVDWRVAIERGATFGELLDTALAAHPNVPEPALQAVLDRYGFTDLFLAATQWQQQLDKTDPLERFFALAPATLRIVMPLTAGKNPAFRGTMSGIPTQLEGGSVVLHTNVHSLSLDYEGTQLTADSLAYAIDFRKFPETVELALKMSALPVLPGLDVGNRITWQAGGRLQARGLDLKLQRAATLQRITADSMLVTITPR